MTSATAETLATELLEAYRDRRLVSAPTGREGGLDLATAYAVEAEILSRRIAAGHRPVGLKVGFANKAAWRILKLDTLVWAHMYDDTVQHATGNRHQLAVAPLVAPKIEPEIVACVKQPVPADGDATAVLGAVEWIALGFEIIDCVFVDWQFQPADFVASKGLHAGLIVGTPLTVTAANRAELAEAMPGFGVRLLKGGHTMASGSGKNVLRSPALCLGELAAALARAGTPDALRAGTLVSTGTLTESQFIHAGDTWRAELEGLPLPPLTVTTS